MKQGKRGSRAIHALVSILTVVGLVNLYSASAIDGHQHFHKQLIFDALGLTIYLVATYLIDYRLIARLSWLMYGIANAGLVTVLVFGHSAGGSQRWFAIGPLRFQPSEFAKIATIFLLANLLAKRSASLKSWREIILYGSIVLIPFGLIAIEPDLGTGATILLIGSLMLLYNGIKPKLLMQIVLTMAFSVGAAWTWGLKPYQKSRVLTMFNPESNPRGSGYQVIQSKIAIASGGMTGRGFGTGQQTHGNFLPEQHSDFAYAVVAEEWGLLGATIVVVLFLLLIEQYLRISYVARESLGSLLAVGTAAYIALPVHINILMVLGWFPIVGLPLPFFTYGGTHMLTTYAMLGLAHAVYARRNLF